MHANTGFSLMESNTVSQTWTELEGPWRINRMYLVLPLIWTPSLNQDIGKSVPWASIEYLAVEHEKSSCMPILRRLLLPNITPRRYLLFGEENAAIE